MKLATYLYWLFPSDRGLSWLAALLALELPVAARVGIPPLSLQQPVLPAARVQQLVLATMNVQNQLAIDAKTGNVTPLRFAVAQSVQVTPATHGSWEQLSGGRLWRLRILSTGATDLNFGFTTFWLPDGATLHVMSEHEDYFQGPYTAADNNPEGHGGLWTPVVPGEAAVIELFVPSQAHGEPQLVLTQINSGYRDLFHQQASLTAHGADTCNIDVVCPVAAAWSNEIRSVACYSIAGTTLCSGTLVADTAGDFRNYFLTANHCGLNAGNAASVVVYWNYQSPVCGQHGGGSLAQNQAGAVFRAAKPDVDFSLIELTAVPDASFKVFYSGWDRSGSAPAGAVGIHHPSVSEKSISFSSNAPTTVNSCIETGGVNTHWQVVWSAGVTAPGSSGSGLWNPATHQLIGTLSGGGSSCTASTSPDCYGKFAVAWASGSSSSDRLRDWLDPQNTGVTNIQGIDPAFSSIITPAGFMLLSESCTPTNGAIDPGENVTVGFTLKNLGGLATTNLVATLLASNGVNYPSAPKTYGTMAGAGSAVTQSFNFTATGTCGGTIMPTLQLQDETRDLGLVSFAVRLGATIPTLVLSQNFDAVPVPALPAGWTSSPSGAGSPWITSSAQSDTTPNSAFAIDSDSISDNQLVSPVMLISSSNSQLSFRHYYNTEAGYDGGVVEIAINGGAFNDIISAGGTFVANGYNATISSYYQNPLSGRQAWSGDVGGFITTVVNLPATAMGQTIQLRWRFGSDNSTGSVGWYVDTVFVSIPTYVCCSSLVPPVIINLSHNAGNPISFSYDSRAGQTYFVETTTNLATLNWTILLTSPGDGSRLSFTNSITAETQRYFRLRTE